MAAEGAAWAEVLPSFAGHELALAPRTLVAAAAEGALTASPVEAEVEAAAEALRQCRFSWQVQEAAELSLRLLPLQVVAVAVAVPWPQTLAAAAEGQVRLRLALPEVAGARAPCPPTWVEGGWWRRRPPFPTASRY